MTGASLSPAMQRFVDYFAELGPRWGLPAGACRVHAYLYLVAAPVPQPAMAEALAMNEDEIAEALTFLSGYRMAAAGAADCWHTSGDPWDMLLRGLEERRQRELPVALDTLRTCHREALGDKAPGRGVAVQMGKMLELAEDLAAIDAQARHLSPRLLRGLVGVTGRAARVVDRAFGTRRGKT